MRILQSIATVLICSSVMLSCSTAHAGEVRGDFALLGQVRDGDQSREREAPNILLGDAGVSGLWYGSRVETFFGLQRDFARGEDEADFYAGYAQVPGAIPGIDVTGGRQFISEGPGGVFVADAGRIRIDRGWPVSFTLYGGRPRYFEPTVSSSVESRDEVLWGGSVRSTRFKGGQLGLGYQQLERDQRVLRQLVTATATRTLPGVPGLPTFYGSLAYDADRQNLDLANAGVNLFFAQPRLHLNFAGTYYKPQDHEDDRPTKDRNRREDTIFELFANSEMAQWRGGVRYPLSKTVAAFGDYSFQHYDQQKGDQTENSHVGAAGLVWLPGGDGLEVVRLEYYVIDGDGGNVNGGKAYYESRVYERLLFRTKIDVTYYEKESNQADTAISGLLGIGYTLLPGLTWELDFEANHNDRFDEDFRFGFAVNYNFHHRIEEPRLLQGES